MTSPQALAISEPTAPASQAPLRFGFDTSYLRLPERFYGRVKPTPVPAPRLVKLNVALARTLGLDADALNGAAGAAIFSGNLLPADADPLAMAYAGHQFGYFVPQLGDGRAILLGEVVAKDGRRYDIQLKGPGRTPYSRGGDGRAAIGPVLREYLVSEAMAALGVPSTRALAAVTTGAKVMRETVLPGAVFTRVAASHLRVGTFQFFAARKDTEGLRTLADYAIARHYPEAADSSSPYRAFLDRVITRHAKLVAQWLHFGFVHGVMNTDNSSISGETIDYGPCAFLEAYDPETVFSSIDRQGRYAYGNQPDMDLWNLTRLAECLLPLLEEREGSADAALESAKEALSGFASQFHTAHVAGLRHKIGLSAAQESDGELIQDLMDKMAANRADFTLTFRRLCHAAADPAEDAGVRALFADPAAYDAWAPVWRERLKSEALSGEALAASMRRVNPIYIPRNHLVQAVIDAAVSADDFQPFEDLLAVVTNPYEDHPGMERFAIPARPEERVTQTFCGT